MLGLLSVLFSNSTYLIDLRSIQAQQDCINANIATDRRSVHISTSAYSLAKSQHRSGDGGSEKAKLDTLMPKFKGIQLIAKGEMVVFAIYMNR